MKTTMTKQEMAEMLADAQGRIANLKATVETLNGMLVERARQLQGAPVEMSPLVAFAASLPPKKLHRILALALHPDRGGDTASMQELNAAWAATAG